MVTFRLNLSGSELSSFDVEDSDWSSEIDIPSTLSAGNYTVIVSFVSSSDTLPDEKVELPLSILGTSTISLDTDSIKVTRGDTITLEGELVRSPW